jgi:hypothetical protein
MMEKKTLPPMTTAQWFLMPAVVRYFHPLERARKPLVIEEKPQLEEGAEPFQYFLKVRDDEPQTSRQ